MMANALLVIDVQECFLENAPKDLPEKIIKHYRSVTYDHIIFTRFINKPGSNFVKSLKWTKCADTSDAKLPAIFDQYFNKDNVFTKSTYSALKNPKLHEFLQSHSVERLVLCGIDSDACVLATAFEAFDLGYHVKIDYGLSYSSNDLQKASEQIANKSIISRD